MILDGYTQSGVFGGVYVEYRPMLFCTRKAVLTRAAKSADAERVMRRAIRPHLVWTDSPVRVTLELVEAVTGSGDWRAEKEDADNLFHGTLLKLRHPKLLEISCDQCRKYEFYPLEGRFGVHRVSQVPRERAGMELLCETPQGCPKGHWSAPVTLSPKNQQALVFDAACRAVGLWPDDPIVQRTHA